MNVTTVLAFVLSLLIQVSYPLAVTLIYRRRTRAPWPPFVYGIVVFALFQLFTWLPLSVYIDTVLEERLRGEWAAFVWLLALAFFTALIEESGRWWGYYYLFRRGGYGLSWRNGVMYGLGQGSVETMLLIAGLTFVYLAAYVTLSGVGLEAAARSLDVDVNTEIMTALHDIVATTWVQPLTVAFERILALPHQVAWALLVMQSHLSRQKRWFGFAVLYHWSVGVIVPGLARLGGFALAEGVNLLLALFSLWLILRFRATDQERLLG
ncbi:MAG: YhfC family intramembrane metalloprotease [Chloroflexi bacterium]|nr:YhfC family intramembrane metalloprotease [Chloroflexota bacterium]